MLFGNVNSFAIEAELLELYGKWTYAKLRFWIGGQGIGDFNDTSDLASSARWGRTFLQESSRRTRVDLDEMPAPDVYELLYGRFVIDITRVDITVKRPRSPISHEHWDRRPYLLDDVGESSLRDKFAVLAVRRRDGHDRIIVKSFRDDVVSEVLLPPGECDATIALYCTWVEGLRSSAE